MERIQYSTTIVAPKEKVWEALWNDESYSKWTAPFCEGSYAVTDWQEGSKVLFMSPTGEGMVSRVAARNDNEFMSFEHLGEVKNGIEDTESESVQKWKGAQENYTLTSENGATKLTVEVDINEAYRDYLTSAWPRALEQLKLLTESQ